MVQLIAARIGVSFKRTTIRSLTIYLCIQRAVRSYSRNDNPVTNLTNTPDRIERTPSLSGDGSRIAYWADGSVYIANVEK